MPGSCPVRSSVFRHLAAGDQHRDDDRHLPDGVPDPEQSEPGSAAIRLEPDELIRATRGAHIALLNPEELDDRMLAAFRARYEKPAREARARQAQGLSDTDVPDA